MTSRRRGFPKDLCACELGPNDITFQRLRAGVAAMEKVEGASRVLP